jgi:tetratricopeptide (TPR) repeat protein
MMRQLNLVFLTGFLAVSATLGVGIHFLHGYQVQRQASVLWDRAQRAEKDQDLAKAAELLSQYLSIKREHGDAWALYARVVDQRTPEGTGAERPQVYLIYEQALRHNPGDRALERRCADLAFELGRYSDARRHYERLLQPANNEPLLQRADNDPGSESAEAQIEDRLGQCDQGESKLSEAEVWFLKAIAHDEGQVNTYDRLARMLRTELRKADEADQWIERMVKVNPTSARAYLNRWRYRAELHPPADPGDVEQALQLGPDDPEVLLFAAGVSEQRRDPATAREYLRKGLKLAPKDTALPLELAWLEVQDGHPDRAETVLREAIEANPKLELLWFVMADTLIGLGKIEGKDQAAEYIARLRNSNVVSEGYVPYLEARVLVKGQRWSEAIAKINTSRSLFGSDFRKPDALKLRTMGQLNLMLVECYDRLGLDEQRLAALRQAAGGATTSVQAGLVLAQELERSGKLDESLKVHLGIVGRRPESRLAVVRLLITKTLRQPREQRNWQEVGQQVEQQLQKAKQTLPEARAELTLLRCDLFTAQGRFDEARRLVEEARTKDPTIAGYRIALAKIAQSQGNAPLATQILDQAEKDLGPNLDVRLARLEFSLNRDVAEAKAVLAELARTSTQLSPANQPAFLEALARAAYRLADVPLGRKSLRELLGLYPSNARVMKELFDLPLEAGDLPGAAELVDKTELVDKMRRSEGEDGTLWRYVQARYLIELAPHGDTEGLETARSLVAEIVAKRGDWWAGPLLQGMLAERRGEVDAAIADYLHSIELGCLQRSMARALLALLIQKQEFGQTDRVVQIFRERGVDLGKPIIVAVLNAIRSKDFKQGIALAHQAFPETSPRATDHLSLGSILLAAGQAEEAGKELRRATELGPGIPETWLAYVGYLAQAKQVDQAKATIEAARRDLPADRAALTLALCLALVGDTQQAESQFRAALAAQPGHPPTLRSAAGFYLAQRRYEQAQPLLDKLLDPKTGASSADLAWANQTKGLIGLATLEREARKLKEGKRDQDLLAFLQARARQSPNEMDVVAGLLDEFGFATQAEDTYRAAIARTPTDPQLVLALASFLARQARIDEAIEILKQVWTTCPPEPIAKLAVGIYNLPSANEAQKSQIEAWLVEAIQKHPEAAGLVPKLALIRLRQGRPDEAEPLLRRTLTSNPENPEALNYLAWVLSHRDRSKCPEALELINRAIDVAGEDPARLDTRAVIYLQLGQIDRALQDLGRCLSLRPLSGTSYFHLAQAHLLAKNEGESRKALRRAEDLGLKPETADPLERDTYFKLRQELGPR